MKKVKKKVKKRVTKGSVSKEFVLKGAIGDLEAEIGRLMKEKASLKGSLSNVGSTLDLDHKAERELQKKIAQLIEKEAKLNEKKKKLQSKLDNVSDKMNKISKIKSEMADI